MSKRKRKRLKRAFRHKGYRDEDILTIEDAITCFSHSFYNTENKKVTFGVCRECGAPLVIIEGLPEKGRGRSGSIPVKEYICRNRMCKVTVKTVTLDRKKPPFSFEEILKVSA